MAKTPVVVITDLYHPYQDPGDNMDLILGFGLPDADLRGVILDITDAFRKPVADHPTLWKDPRGPREAGIVPVTQLNYIFGRDVPWAIGPLEMMTSEEDTMESWNGGVDLLLDILRRSDAPVEILSFGSARVLAVAYNRDPGLMMAKVGRVHLSAGTASSDYIPGSDAGANAIPGGEWNVALDPMAFRRIVLSPLPVAIYPCAGRDGGFVKDLNNTYWQLPDMEFTRRMNPRLRRYLDYAFLGKLQYDLLRAMDADYLFEAKIEQYPVPFHVWESAVWLKALGREIILTGEGEYLLVDREVLAPGTPTLTGELRECRITEMKSDGRFLFEYGAGENKQIYYRPDVGANEKALQQVIPELYISISPR